MNPNEMKRYGMSLDPHAVASDNRREWLRIADRLLLDYWLVGEHQRPVPKEPAQATDEAITNFVTKPTSDLLANIPCEDAEPVLVPWLKKIDWVLELLLKSHVRMSPGSIALPQLTEMNISAGGISFHTIQRFREGDLLEIRLILPPFTPIRAKGEVIRAESAGPQAQGCTMAAKFTEISQDDQERLIRYILSVQAKQLRGRHAE